jgi:hypothetical protein
MESLVLIVASIPYHVRCKKGGHTPVRRQCVLRRRHVCASGRVIIHFSAISRWPHWADGKAQTPVVSAVPRTAYSSQASGYRVSHSLLRKAETLIGTGRSQWRFVRERRLLNRKRAKYQAGNRDRAFVLDALPAVVRRRHARGARAQGGNHCCKVCSFSPARMIRDRTRRDKTSNWSGQVPLAVRRGLHLP